MTKDEFIPLLFGYDPVNDGPVRKALTEFLSGLPHDVKRCCSEVESALLVVLCRLYPEPYTTAGPPIESRVIDEYQHRARKIFKRDSHDPEMQVYIDAVNLNQFPLLM